MINGTGYEEQCQDSDNEEEKPAVVMLARLSGQYYLLVIIMLVFNGLFVLGIGRFLVEFLN